MLVMARNREHHNNSKSDTLIARHLIYATPSDQPESSVPTKYRTGPREINFENQANKKNMVTKKDGDRKTWDPKFEFLIIFRAIFAPGAEN